MSCLLYCISRSPDVELSGPLLGVGGRPVYQLDHRRLSAAVSEILPADLAPNLPRLRTYGGVVVSLHQRRTVIPMQYGCVVSEESHIVQLLDEHGSRYEALLQELDGCVEMGLRLLLPSLPGTAPAAGGTAECREVAGPGPGTATGAPRRPGVTYLTARKAHYARQDRWTSDYRHAADRCLARFSGLFVKSKLEAPTPRLPLLSIYFLVPGPAVDSFRQTFRDFAATEPAKLLLSGPWPPYNFVTSGPRLREFLKG